MGRFLSGSGATTGAISGGAMLLPGQLQPFGSGRFQLFFENGVFIPKTAAPHRIRVLGGGAYGLQPGGSSSFGALISATGGASAVGDVGGLGGIGVGGDFQARGGQGGAGVTLNPVGGSGVFLAGGGGGGAGSPLGDGGAGGMAWNNENYLSQRKGGGGGAVGGKSPLPASYTRAGLGASVVGSEGQNVLGDYAAEPTAGIMRHVFDGFRGARGEVLNVIEGGSGGSTAKAFPAGSGAGGHGVFTGGLTIAPSSGGAGGGGGGGQGDRGAAPTRAGAKSAFGGGGGGVTSAAESEPAGGGGGGGYAHGVFDLVEAQSYAVTVAAGAASPGLVIVEW